MKRKKFFANMHALVEELEEPTDFFEANSDRYLEIARKIARQTLAQLRPPERDLESWEESTKGFVDFITASILTSPSGLRIEQAGKINARKSEQGKTAGATTPITYNDVLEWVEAGTAGNPDGKDITAADSARTGGSGRTEEHIAHSVYGAITQARLGIANKDYSAIEQRLIEWVNRETSGSMGNFHEAIAAAWEVALGAQIENDFGRYLEKKIRRL